MADAASAIAAVVSLANVSARVASKIQFLVYGWRDAPRLMHSIAAEADALKLILGTLQAACIRNHSLIVPEKFGLATKLQERVSQAQSLLSDLEQITVNLERHSEAARRMEWLSKHSKIAAIKHGMKELRRLAFEVLIAQDKPLSAYTRIAIHTLSVNAEQKYGTVVYADSSANAMYRPSSLIKSITRLGFTNLVSMKYAIFETPRQNLLRSIATGKNSENIPLKQSCLTPRTSVDCFVQDIIKKVAFQPSSSSDTVAELVRQLVKLETESLKAMETPEHRFSTLLSRLELETFTGKTKASTSITRTILGLRRRAALYHSSVLKAAYYGASEDLIGLLLDTGAIPSTSDIRGSQPIHYVSRNRRLDVLQHLLNYGVHVDQPDSQERTPLIWTAFFNRRNLVQYLLKMGAGLDYMDADGATALHLAVKNNSHACLIYLLQSYADPRTVDKESYKLLHTADRFGDAETMNTLAIAKLIEINLDAYTSKQNTMIDVFTHDRLSPPSKQMRKAFRRLFQSIHATNYEIFVKADRKSILGDSIHGMAKQGDPFDIPTMDKRANESVSRPHDSAVRENPVTDFAANHIREGFGMELETGVAEKWFKNMEATETTSVPQEVDAKRPKNFKIPEDSMTPLKEGPSSKFVDKITVTPLWQPRGPELSLWTRIYGYVRKYTRPKVPKGYQRIEWLCDCGEVMYGDYQSSDPRSVAAFQSVLQMKSKIKRNDSVTETYSPVNDDPGNFSNTSPGHHDPSSGPCPTVPSLVQLQGAHGQIPRDVASNPLDNQPMPMVLATERPASLGQGERRFFELCVNTGGFYVSLGEIDITNVTCDGELFRKIFERYKKLRGHRFRRMFIKPVDVHFVRISVEERHRVGIYEKHCSIPPEKEVQEGRYHYEEIPLQPLPPIDFRTFLHWMESKKHHACTEPSTISQNSATCSQFPDKDLWLRRLPKKVGTELVNQNSCMVFGWGVHIIEGPNKRTLSYAIFVCLVLNFLISILYHHYWKTEEQGFGIGQWMISVLAVGISAFYFHCEDV